MKLLIPCGAVLLLALIFPAILCGQAGPSAPAQTSPRIFFSDLDSGPNIGGQKNLGVWVTIWGKGFGAERGASTVTIGGGAAAEYPIWTDTRITFQLGPAARTGDIVVSVREKAARAGEGQPTAGMPNRSGQAGKSVPATLTDGRKSVAGTSAACNASNG